MSAFDAVAASVKAWNPQPSRSELGYRDSLIAYLREQMRDVRIEPEYRHMGTTTDIYVKQAGLFAGSDVFVELKRNLRTKAECDRLVGQIESLQPKSHAILVVLCGASDPKMAERLRAKYGVPKGFLIKNNAFEVIIKKCEPTTSGHRQPRIGPSNGELRAALDAEIRQVREARISPNIWARLIRLRAFFLQHDLTDVCKANRNFFNKWLTGAPVEMGWTPGNGWTGEKAAELHADLETIQISRRDSR